MDTIVAFSGGSLPCAIGIIRLSGDDALGIFKKIFVSREKHEARKLLYGKALGRDEKTIDLCLAAFFVAPKSYTGENMVEIYCHGSSAVVDELLKNAVRHGARMAQAGEFTKRGFLNGKLDLTSAEAVGDLIHASSLTQVKSAVNQLNGGIYNKINELYKEITHMLAHFYAVCDYSDEDIEPWEYENAIEILSRARRGLTKLFSTFERGSTIKNGLPCAIIGRPNVGKSSLLNALLGYERAIVTDEEGTTRDTVEDTIQLKGTILRLIDTAGIREGDSLAEKMGIERSLISARAAKLVICVIDGTKPLNEDDFKAIEVAKNAEISILIVNKTDVMAVTDEKYGFEKVFKISAKSGEGIEQLTDYLGGLIKYDDSEALVTNARQAALLERGAEAFSQAEQSAKMGQTADAFLFDAERGLEYLGEIMGKKPNSDILNEIFSKFCVGK